MKCFYCVFFISTFYLSCNSTIIKNDSFSIIGEIKGLPTNKIYLTDAYRASIILDSADYINGKFAFDYKIAPNSDPSLVSLRFINNKNNAQNVILIRNPFSPENGSSGFMLEKGRTLLSGEFRESTNNLTNLIDIISGKENEVFFKVQNNNFGAIKSINDPERKNEINSFERIIKNYSSSYYLLRQIYSNKETFSKKELEKIFKLFDIELQESNKGRELNIFINSVQKKVSNFSGLSFLSATGKIVNVIDTSAKMNVIIFWASWCAPCREEIPFLKSVYSQFKDRNIRFTSISIDENIASWEKALKSENMDWQQLITRNSDLNSVKTNFGFSSIPLIILTNGKGEEKYRLSGYNKEDLDKLIGICRLELVP